MRCALGRFASALLTSKCLNYCCVASEASTLIFAISLSFLQAKDCNMLLVQLVYRILSPQHTTFDGLGLLAFIGASYMGHVNHMT